ncbi:serine/threonine protein kinase [Streptomyces pilosus]|uniref:serine/threonine-protein kinase n=1 Tax=Streptomyces pilosus TaxID=28893 RepID=UPI0016734FF4|nr:serine/threonine-protein kinase [Streptomyces pilosus]GGV50410.1 serine/threonine protein kinase [Streptomyces pilosus]
MRPLDVDEPTVVGPYRLLGRLGSGGMGRVYLGRSAGGRTVAVKIVHPHFALDEEFRARFRREVDAARRVGGAWTASVLDADPEARVPWVATAYAAGPSLAAAVTDAGPLPAHSVRTLGAGLAEALTAVHELGLVHRDVKPSNVLLTLDGPLLIDFGITRAMDGTASLTSTGVSIGSPGYMSPEQILGKGVTGAADVFSLGAVLAYAATGRPPFPGDSSAALLYKVVHEPPELGELGGDVRDVAEACLHKDPSARPAPAEVARRLAPGGAAPLVAGGWLPGPLVEQVSRAAVRLLNLEAAGDGPASGPLGFSRPSVSGPPGTGAAGPPAAGVASGVFGPPPVMPGPQERSGTVVPGPRDAPGAPGNGPEANPYVTPRPTAGPAGAGEGPDGAHRPGRLSVSVAATASPGAGGRGRRVSCTVALAVAGALAAVTVGSAFVLDWLPGTSTGGGAGADDGADPQAPAPVVPAGYLGTWEGQATSRDTVALPLGTFRVTLQRAGVGEKVGTLRHTDIFGGTCDDVLTLKQVTEKRLVTTSVGAENNRGVCDQEAHTVLLTPVGDDLVYESDSKPSGRPEARLSKIGESPAASSSGSFSGPVPGTSRGSAQVARPTPPDRRGRRAKGPVPGRSA